MRVPATITCPQDVKTFAIFPTLLHVGDTFLTPEKLATAAECAQDKSDVDDDEIKAAVLAFGLNALVAQHVDVARYDALEVTEIWTNVLQPGDHHWDHTHANHILSGIVYLTEECFTIFGDPRPAAAVLAPVYKSPPPGHARSFVYKGKCNSIVVFPSWLPHRVATTPHLRKTISFNLILRGLYGNQMSREQVFL